MKFDIKNNYILKGLIIGFLVGIMIIPFLLLIQTISPLPKNSLLSFFIIGIGLVYYIPLMIYLIIENTYIYHKSYFLLTSTMIIFYTFFGLILGAIYHFIRKKNKRIASIIVLIVLLLFIFFNLWLYSLGPPG